MKNAWEEEKSGYKQEIS